MQAPLHLPSVESGTARSSSLDQIRTLQDNMPDMPDDVKQRLASLLAAEFSKKVCLVLSLLLGLWCCCAHHCNLRPVPLLVCFAELLSVLS